MKKQLSIFALLISLFLITSAQNLDSMLLLYYPFSGNANDISGNNYHGTVNNATLTDDRFGNPNNAYFFNGINSFIEFPNNPALKPPLPISMAFWIKLNDYSDENTRVLTTSYSQDSYHGINVNTHGGRVSVTYGDGSPNSTGPHNRRSKTGTTVLQLNQWHFVVIVVRGANNMDIYINCLNDGGNYSGSGGSMSYSTNPGSLGRYDMWTLVPSYFLGEMDEFRYWNRALTQADIDLMCISFSAYAGPDAHICYGESVQIGGNPPAAGGTPPYSFYWAPTTGLNNPNAPNPTASPQSTTTYSLTVVDAAFMSASDQMTVFVHPNPDISTLNPSVEFCFYEDTILDAGSGFSSYNWSTGETTQNIHVQTSGNYSVTVTNSFGCSASASIEALTYLQHEILITATEPVCSYEATIELNASPPAGVWSGFGVIDSIVGLFSPLETDTGLFYVHYTTLGPCGNSDSAAIRVIDCTPFVPTLYVPNIFSPNGDGENDILFVRGEGVQYIEFIIYNRWGEKIFITNDINKGWDGTHKGKMCDPAVFTYIVNVTFANNEKVVKSGNVTLMK